MGPGPFLHQRSLHQRFELPPDRLLGRALLLELHLELFCEVLNEGRKTGTTNEDFESKLKNRKGSKVP